MNSARRRSLGARLLRILAVLLVLFALIVVGGYFWATQRFAAKPNQLQHLSGTMATSFEWVAHSERDLELPYAAMLVPVSIGTCDRFLMQFDLGATSSVLYRSKIESIGDRCGDPITIDGEPPGIVTGLRIGIGDSGVHAAEIALRSVGGKGIDWSEPDQRVVIGTLGSDLIDGRLLLIDYPARRLVVGETLPGEYVAPVDWGGFTYEDRRVMLATRIADRDTRLYFDTGSSAFELLTSESIWTALKSPDATPDVLTVSSWGRPLTVYRAASDQRIDVAGVKLPLRHVTRVEGASFMQNLLGRVIDMGGMTGNALFVEHVLVLDTRSGQVGIATRK